jgi:hypothetical protein
MKEKTEVHKIDIRIGDKTISLKPEQAKELKKILNDMFEEKERVVHEHHWWYWWHSPTYQYSPYWNVYCTSSAGQSGSLQGGLNSAQGLGYTNTGSTVTLALNTA